MTSLTRSSQIVSSQIAPHKNLEKLVKRYLNSEYQDSIPKHALDAFQFANQLVMSNNRKVVLDSGCGTGESSYRLAQKFPEFTVIGVDKSNDRLQRSHAYGDQPTNLVFANCDCVHFWRLVKQAQWDISHHYLFYPNPWPKPGHLQRRWHGHPIFPTMVSLGGSITMRTNWQIYANEFAQALEILQSSPATVKELLVETPFTPFERKYLHSGHRLYEVVMSNAD